MPRDNLGNKQTIVLHKCIINDERYNLATTPHRQTVGYVRTKRQTLRKKTINKLKQITRKRFTKRRNAVSESETSSIQELHNLKDSINKNHQNYGHIYFSDSETTSPASIKGKCRIKKSYKNNAIRLYNWNQPIRHIENYSLTVIRHRNDSK